MCVPEFYLIFFGRCSSVGERAAAVRGKISKKPQSKWNKEFFREKKGREGFSRWYQHMALGYMCETLFFPQLLLCVWEGATLLVFPTCQQKVIVGRSSMLNGC